jgi:hypothetical protein
VRVGKRKVRSPNTIFHFTCQGQPYNQSTKLLLREGQVNRPIGEVCMDRLVRVAFNQYPDIFEVDMENNEKMVEYPLDPGGAWNYEILSSFFTSYGLTPNFLDCNDTWGSFNETTGEWTGAVALVA